MWNQVDALQEHLEKDHVHNYDMCLLPRGYSILCVMPKGVTVVIVSLAVNWMWECDARNNWLKSCVMPEGVTVLIVFSSELNVRI